MSALAAALLTVIAVLAVGGASVAALVAARVSAQAHKRAAARRRESEYGLRLRETYEAYRAVEEAIGEAFLPALSRFADTLAQLGVAFGPLAEAMRDEER